jgi:hypothetical protein
MNIKPHCYMSHEFYHPDVKVSMSICLIQLSPLPSPLPLRVTRYIFQSFVPCMLSLFQCFLTIGTASPYFICLTDFRHKCQNIIKGSIQISKLYSCRMSLRIFSKSYVFSSYVIKIELNTTGQERMNIFSKN